MDFHHVLVSMLESVLSLSNGTGDHTGDTTVFFTACLLHSPVQSSPDFVVSTEGEPNY